MMRRWPAWQWAQGVTAALTDISSSALDLVLRLRRNVAGVNASQFDSVAAQPNIKVMTRIHESIGAPVNDIGDVGDWWLDVSARRLFGPKTQDGWPAGHVVLMDSAALRLKADERTLLSNYALERVRGPITDWYKPW